MIIDSLNYSDKIEVLNIFNRKWQYEDSETGLSKQNYSKQIIISRSVFRTLPSIQDEVLKTVNSLRSPTIFAKHFILDV